MIYAALQDLQWRKRRVAIAVIGTGLVLAMTMIMTGLSASFPIEASNFVKTLDADTFVFSSRASGPFYGPLPSPENVGDEIAASSGVEDVGPMMLNQAPVKGEKFPRVVLVGVTPGHVGSPEPSTGVAVQRPGEVVLSTKLGKKVGDGIIIGNKDFTVVGTIRSTLFAGTPVAYMPMADGQALYTNGAPIATAFAVRGTPGSLPDTLRVFDNDQTIDNVLIPVESAQQTLSLMAVLLWIVAACVLASSMYLTATERSRDFAVFKATGVSNGAIMGGLAIQAAIISLVAAAIGAILATLLGPYFPVDVTLTATAYVFLPVVALVVGLVASILGMRRVVSVDPAAAFAGP